MHNEAPILVVGKRYTSIVLGADSRPDREFYPS